MTMYVTEATIDPLKNVYDLPLGDISRCHCTGDWALKCPLLRLTITMRPATYTDTQAEVRDEGAAYVRPSDVGHTDRTEAMLSS